MIIFECPNCSSTIKAESLKPDWLINNYCKPCDQIMTEVTGRKPVSITIDGIVSKEGDDLWPSFMKHWNSFPKDPGVSTILKPFSCIAEKEEYLDFLRKVLGLVI